MKTERLAFVLIFRVDKPNDFMRFTLVILRFPSVSGPYWWAFAKLAPFNDIFEEAAP